MLLRYNLTPARDRLALMLVLCLFHALLPTLPAAAQTRHALVIGIDSYAALDDLSRARADAQTMQQSLRALDFEVEKLLDPNRRELMFALIDLQGRIAPGDTVAVFFAGHGVEDGGRNFLLPADTPALRDRADLPGAAVALGDLRDMLHLRRPGVVLMFIDACRDNPLPTDASGTRSVGGSRGLARPETAQGTFILFAAAARQAARDHLGPSDSDPNSVFTRVLLRELARPGLSIQEIGQRTGLEVTRLSAAAGFTQRREYMDGILAPFRLREGEEPDPAPQPDASLATSATLSGHSSRVWSAAFSPDGGRVVTASWDRTARVWGSETGRVIATLSGHRGRVTSAAFSPDGRRIVTASEDNTARIWTVP